MEHLFYFDPSKVIKKPVHGSASKTATGITTELETSAMLKTARQLMT